MASTSTYGKFAEKMMAKQGWKEGQGLGSSNQGIRSAIKPSLKFDKTGMGHDAAKEFTHHWWDIAYNTTAKKIQVNEDVEEGVQVQFRKKVPKKDKKAEKQLKKKHLYSQFLKGDTLVDGRSTLSRGTEEEDVEEEQEEKERREAEAKTISKLSDEELFKACGGLTAHKGARHGHNMTGKQARIDASEKLLLQQLHRSDSLRKRDREEEATDVVVTKKRKKKSKKS